MSTGEGRARLTTAATPYEQLIRFSPARHYIDHNRATKSTAANSQPRSRHNKAHLFAILCGASRRIPLSSVARLWNHRGVAQPHRVCSHIRHGSLYDTAVPLFIVLSTYLLFILRPCASAAVLLLTCCHAIVCCAVGSASVVAVAQAVWSGALFRCAVSFLAA